MADGSNDDGKGTKGSVVALGVHPFTKDIDVACCLRSFDRFGYHKSELKND